MPFENYIRENVEQVRSYSELCIRLVLNFNCNFQWRIQDFPEEGAPTPQGRAPTYNFAKFSQKLHEIERIWAPGGGGARASLAPPLDLPLISILLMKLFAISITQKVVWLLRISKILKY